MHLDACPVRQTGFDAPSLSCNTLAGYPCCMLVAVTSHMCCEPASVPFSHAHAMLLVHAAQAGHLFSVCFWVCELFVWAAPTQVFVWLHPRPAVAHTSSSPYTTSCRPHATSCANAWLVALVEELVACGFASMCCAGAQIAAHSSSGGRCAARFVTQPCLLLLTTGLANGAFILTTAPPLAFTGTLHADQLLVTAAQAGVPCCFCCARPGMCDRRVCPPRWLVDRGPWH